jgi:hypothetical protein
MDKISPTKQALKKQIEYYLSDGNLKKDRFFHDLIAADTKVTHCINLGLTSNRDIFH